VNGDGVARALSSTTPSAFRSEFTDNRSPTTDHH
jgi:hypothetical protein